MSDLPRSGWSGQFIPADRADRQQAFASVALGPFEARAATSVTPTGLLAIGGLVSAILLSTAVLVGTAAIARGRAARD